MTILDTEARSSAPIMAKMDLRTCEAFLIHEARLLDEGHFRLEDDRALKAPGPPQA